MKFTPLHDNELLPEADGAKVTIDPRKNLWILALRSVRLEPSHRKTLRKGLSDTGYQPLRMELIRSK